MLTFSGDEPDHVGKADVVVPVVAGVLSAGPHQAAVRAGGGGGLAVKAEPRKVLRVCSCHASVGDRQ